MRFRKKPVEIDALQWDGSFESGTKIVIWSDNKVVMTSLALPGVPGAPVDLAIKTLEGVLTASPGDWIIRGVAGEYYPCKPEIFSTTYEPVDTE